MDLYFSLFTNIILSMFPSYLVYYSGGDTWRSINELHNMVLQLEFCSFLSFFYLLSHFSCLFLLTICGALHYFPPQERSGKSDCKLNTFLGTGTFSWRQTEMVIVMLRWSRSRLGNIITCRQNSWFKSIN